MKTIILTILSSIIICVEAFSLGRSNYPEVAIDSSTTTLSIGDRVPDVLLSNVSNYEKESLRLSEFKGKLIILDFWGVGCSPCIKSMPKMQELQKKHEDQLKVILVTKDSREQVNRLFNKLDLIKDVHLTSIVEDTVLRELFPFRSVPTHVWINEEGIVEQITSGYNTTEEELEKYFTGKEVILTEIRQHKDFDYKQPLWTEGDGRQMKYLQYYSYIMEYTPDAGGLTGTHEDPQSDKKVRIFATNQSILQLCKMAYGENTEDTFNPFKYNNRVILEVEDTNRFLYPRKVTEISNWQKNNLYSYELVVPPSKSDQLFEFMQQDLERFFGVKGRIEKRTKDCMVLKMRGEGEKLRTREAQVYFNSNYGEKLELQNLSIEWLLNMLRSYHGRIPTPLIDGTGYQKNIDIVIEAPLKNMEAVKEELKKYDLELVQEEKEIEVLVLWEE